MRDEEPPNGIDGIFAFKLSDPGRVISVVRVRDRFIITTEAAVYRVSEDLDRHFVIERVNFV